MSSKKKPQPQMAIVERVRKETKDTSTLFLKLSEPFLWEPGQFIMISAIIDDVNIRRAYSVASAPTRNNLMEITVRQTETPTMSKYLNEVRAGDELSIRGPYGRFIWTEVVNEKVFMLGAGSGITPFKAFLEYIKDKNLRVKPKLLYSCAYGDNVIFDDLLLKLTKEIPNCEYKLTLTRETNDEYSGRRGRIDLGFLREEIQGFEEGHFYLCGTPGFVTAMMTNLESLGIPKEHIKREQWG